MARDLGPPSARWLVLGGSHPRVAPLARPLHDGPAQITCRLPHACQGREMDEIVHFEVRVARKRASGRQILLDIVHSGLRSRSCCELLRSAPDARILRLS